MKKNLLKFALISSAIATTFPAFADTGWYAGVGFGQSNVSDWLTKDDAESLLGVAGDSLGVVSFNGTISSSSDDTGSAWKLFGGYNFNDNFALEATYVDLGEVTAKSTATGTFNLGGSNTFPGSLGVKVKGESSALTLDAVGKFKPTSYIDLFAKAGLYNAQSKLTVTVTPTDSGGAYPESDSTDDSNTNLHFGLGANGWFTNNLGVRLEWEMLKNVTIAGADVDISVVSASLMYKF